MRWIRTLFHLALLALLFTGCKVGPNYRRPPVATPDTYRGLPGGQAAKAETASFGDQKWWDAFQDEQLKKLIETALQQNYDTRIAAARILEAQAQLGITRADQLPTITGNVGALNERIPASAQIPATNVSANQINASLQWELDFWGKFRRATEAARASLLASQWARQEVIRTLVSDVAVAYFQLRELDLELAISQRTLTSREDSLRLTKLLADHGATSMLDVRQAEQLVFGAAASVPDLERQIEQQENLISVLLGRNPEPIPRGRALTEQPHPPEVPAGIPSALLERRPDIREAEQQLVAFNAQIGVAKANLLPQISLTASGGYQSSALTSLLTGPAGLWTFGGQLAQPIYTGGKLRSAVRLAEAQQQEAVLFYEKTAQQAFREVSDALIGYRKSQEFRAQQEQLTRSAEDATRLSNMRYKGGVTSYLEVLDSETRYFAAQLTLAQSQLNELQFFVQIYKALGGGWQ
ncbi:MAG TPA: efflux transporter outer membrane subunit [Candidatus Angelobacter sp.]|nr:efflux transporter outer membrane subunit [Candidatus Angelobacter sp.]